MDLSIILPAYLEEKNLRVLLPRIRSSVEPLNISYEVLVIDTVTPLDQTAAACRANGLSHINRQDGNTYGDAVRTGIARAQGRYILFMDADGSHAPEFIGKLYARRDSADVIVASRYVAQGGSHNSRVLKFMSWIVNRTFAVVLDLDCLDVSNSFKLYRRNSLAAIKLKCRNFDVIEEILVRLKRNDPGLTIREIPYYFEKRMFGRTKRNLVVFAIFYLVTLLSR